MITIRKQHSPCAVTHSLPFSVFKSSFSLLEQYKNSIGGPQRKMEKESPV